MVTKEVLWELIMGNASFKEAEWRKRKLDCNFLSYQILSWTWEFLFQFSQKSGLCQILLKVCHRDRISLGILAEDPWQNSDDFWVTLVLQHRNSDRFSENLVEKILLFTFPKSFQCKIRLRIRLKHMIILKLLIIFNMN